MLNLLILLKINAIALTITFRSGMMKFYFVRHGKTEWNAEGRFQGAEGDSPLLDESILELKELGDYLKSVHFDAVFSSDLKRARKTAKIIMEESDFPRSIIYTPALREWKLGKLEGSKISTMKSIYPKQMNAFRHNLAKFNYSMFEAESLYQTTQRVYELIISMKNQSYENVLLVGHGANFTTSIRSLLGHEPATIRDIGGLNNGSVTILETNDFKTFTCLLWNDKSYLEENNSALIKRY